MPYRLFSVFVSLAFTCPRAAVAGEQQAGETAKGTARISITIPERLDVRAAEPEAGVLCVQTAVHYRVSVLKPGEREAADLQLSAAQASLCRGADAALRVVTDSAGKGNNGQNAGEIVLLFEPS